MSAFPNRIEGLHLTFCIQVSLQKKILRLSKYQQHMVKIGYKTKGGKHNLYISMGTWRGGGWHVIQLYGIYPRKYSCSYPIGSPIVSILHVYIYIYMYIYICIYIYIYPSEYCIPIKSPSEFAYIFDIYTCMYMLSSYYTANVMDQKLYLKILYIRPCYRPDHPTTIAVSPPVL